MFTIQGAAGRHQVISQREGLKVVRLFVPPGATIPAHAANTDVVATVIRGRGRFVVRGEAVELQPGRVIEMAPGQLHSIEADEELELVVVHARLLTQPGLPEVACGALVHSRAS